MTRLNKVVQDMPPSGIRKFFDVVSEMEGALSLGVGEPDFITPWNIREAAIYSIEQGATHYTSNWGTPQLRRNISRYMDKRFGLQYDPHNEILVTVGVSEGIDVALRAIINPGDEVLLPEPSYVSYAPGVLLAGGVPVGIKTNMSQEFRITPEDILARITPKTKAMIFPYPNNPTGAVMEKEHVEAIAKALADKDIIVLSDEVYAELTYTGHPHVSIASMPAMANKTIVLSGFSKSFAMTGWRLGYACGPADLIHGMYKIHQYTMLCAPITGQIAATEGLRYEMEHDFAQVEKMRREYNRRRRFIVKAFNDMGLDCFEPKGAFYAFPNISCTGMTSEAFCDALLQEEKMAVVPGTAFGPSGEGHVRCSYAYSTDAIKRALERIERFVARHRKG